MYVVEEAGPEAVEPLAPVKWVFGDTSLTALCEAACQPENPSGLGNDLRRKPVMCGIPWGLTARVSRFAERSETNSPAGDGWAALVIRLFMTLAHLHL
jgi:hypothetical protein